MGDGTEMKDLMTQQPATLTANEIGLIVENRLLQQEQRITKNFSESIKELTKDLATKEELAAVDQKHTTKAAVQDRAIKALEDERKWVVRVVLGLVISAVLGVVLTIK